MEKSLTFWQKGGKNSRKYITKERAHQIASKAGTQSGVMRRAKSSKKPV